MRIRNVQKSLVMDMPIIVTPPTRWLNARNRSAAKFRSANWLPKNRPMIAATGNAFRIHDCSNGV